MRTSITIDLDDYIEDADLIQLAVDRDLGDEIAAAVSKTAGCAPIDVNDLCLAAAADLACRRHQRALERLESAMASLVPVYLADALRALREGRVLDASVALDHHLHPSPAATITQAQFAVMVRTQRNAEVRS